jgi:erythromycin esterase-like protein
MPSLPAKPLPGLAADYDDVLDLIGRAKVVVLGIASHGSHELYRERARITRRLIEDRGFNVIAVEADWPDAHRVNRFVRGTSENRTAEEALRGFRRFPSWLWRNADVLSFVGWLRAHNETARHREAVGFYGLDLYSLYASVASVLDYLELVDPLAAERARERYSCFDQVDREGFFGARPADRGRTDESLRQAVSQLSALHLSAEAYVRRDGTATEEEQFYAEQSARMVANANAHYRAIFGSGAESKSVRDRHMADTLERLIVHLERRRKPVKVVVWEHNAHAGDARMTSLARRGEISVGQLVRQRWKREAILVGLTTFSGTVTASGSWDGLPERKFVPPALPGSYEALFHGLGEPRFFIDLRGDQAPALRKPRLERAIGAIYRPEVERDSHYFEATLAGQFDAVVHIDETRAAEPLERTAGWEWSESPRSYPPGP